MLSLLSIKKLSVSNFVKLEQTQTSCHLTHHCAGFPGNVGNTHVPQVLPPSGRGFGSAQAPCRPLSPRACCRGVFLPVAAAAPCVVRSHSSRPAGHLTGPAAHPGVTSTCALCVEVVSLTRGHRSLCWWLTLTHTPPPCPGRSPLPSGWSRVTPTCGHVCCTSAWSCTVGQDTATSPLCPLRS